MITVEEIVQALGRNAAIAERQAAGLSHAESLIQPPVRGNCMNWVLGHIVHSRNLMLESLGAPHAIEHSLIERYQRESQPVAAPGDAPATLEELLGALRRSQELLGAAAAQATPEQLSAEQRLGSATMTVAQLLFFRYFHESYHVGQLELLRQLAGRDDKVI